MKRFFHKYLYAFMIVSIFLLSAGCDISSITNLAGSQDEELLDDNLPAPVSLEDKNNADADDKANKAEEKKEETIDLSSHYGVLDIDAGGRTAPFVPYRERNLSYSSLNFGDLPLPPASGSMDETLNNLITAKVTGILYDENSPSALINVLDDDYLVKKGDKIESFEIAGISKDYVAIKTGTNIYRAKVGDIVDGELYGTGVYNLGHRFAGVRNPARAEDILIVKTAKKKGEDNQNKKAESLKDLSLPPVPEIKLKTQAGEIPLPVGNINSTIPETN